MEIGDQKNENAKQEVRAKKMKSVAGNISLTSHHDCIVFEFLSVGNLMLDYNVFTSLS